MAPASANSLTATKPANIVINGNASHGIADLPRKHTLNPLYRFSDRVDALSDRIGQLIGWLTLGMVLLGAFNALARYTGKFTGVNLSSNAYIELQWYLFSLIFLLGAAHTLQRDQHVRVDVLYGMLSPRGQARIDLAGTLIFLLPFCVFGLVMCWPSVRNSWAVWEVSPDPGGLPRYPLKTAMLLCFALLTLQGFSEAIKRLRILKGSQE